MPLIDTLLITGGGGDIGLSLATFLRQGGWVRTLIGADVRSDTPAAAFYDKVEILPPAADPSYPTTLSALVERHRADAIIPLSEAELSVLLEMGLPRTISRARIVTANAEALAAGLDKLRTFEVLKRASIPTPDTGIVGESQPAALPCIIKPRHGQGSKNVILADEHSYPALRLSRSGDLWQEFMPDADQEYTCGLVRYPGTEIRSIIFRRQLSAGLTGSGTLVSDARIDALLLRVAEALDLRGSINVQLRMYKGEPHIFEINARFSSTAGFRHRLGFRDVVWSICDAVGSPVPAYDPPAPGARIFRVGREVLMDGDGLPIS